MRKFAKEDNYCYICTKYEKSMKILYIYTALTTKGGTDRVISGKANWFAEHGYDVMIVTDTQLGRAPAFPLSPKVRLIDLAVDFSKEYGHSFFLRICIYYRLMYQYRKKLARVIRKESPDIIISTLGRDIGFLMRIKGNSKCIGEAHATKQFIRNFHLLENKNIIFKYLTKYFRWKMDSEIAKLDALVVLAEEHRSDWKLNLPIYVIPNSLSFYPKKYSSCVNKQVIMVGRFNDAKGYDYLIPAWAIVHHRYPDWILNVYGSGELHDQVVSWIHEKKLDDSIILHEPVDNIQEKYLESSVCVLSSRYEGFSLVILEAMACGVPVVSFDCPHGPRNIIRNGEDGLLIDYLDTSALADGLCLLIENEELRKIYGVNARNNILRFSQNAIMKQWEQLFDKLINLKEIWGD